MAERLKDHLVALCPDKQKIKDPLGRISSTSFREYTSAEVLVDDPADLPLDCVRIYYEPMKTEIKKALLDGREDLEGLARIVRRVRPVVRK
jgi:hypothetical protein